MPVIFAAKAEITWSEIPKADHTFSVYNVCLNKSQYIFSKIHIKFQNIDLFISKCYSLLTGVHSGTRSENVMNFFYEHLSDTENFFLLTEFDGCWVNSHFHKSYEFVYVIHGACDVYVNDDSYAISDGDIFAVPSQSVHFLKSERGTKILTLVFAESYFDDFVRDYGNKFFPFVMRDKEKNVEMYRLMNDFYLKNGKGGGESYMRRKIFIDSLLCLMSDSYGVAPVVAVEHNQSICDILVYIDTHFTEKLTLKALAEKFNYNPKYFSTMFNKLVGTNITSYINNIRFNNAKYLLENTDMSVSDVAGKCGFDSLATFYRIMKKYSDSTESIENE